MGWSKMVSMELDDEDQLDAEMPIPMERRPKFPFGLIISLRHDELDKLDLDHPDLGDVIDLRAFARVIGVSTNEHDGGHSCCVSLQIEELAVENEADE